MFALPVTKVVRGSRNKSVTRRAMPARHFLHASPETPESSATNATDTSRTRFALRKQASEDI